MKASATGERNDVALPAGVHPQPAARTDSRPDDSDMNAATVPKDDRSSPSAGAQDTAAMPEAADASATRAAARNPDVAKTPSPPGNAKPTAREKAPKPTAPDSAAPAAGSTTAAVERADPAEAPQVPVAEAPEPKAPVIKPDETPTVQDNSLPSAAPAEAKPQDTKIQDVKMSEVRTGEAKTAEHRPMNGMQGARPVMPVRPVAKEENFVEGDYVVYPTHGVGKVEKIAVEDIAGHRLELIHITFEENRMTLRVPVAKARTAGLRKLATQAKFDEALAVLRGRARIKRTMWSRRAQEYEAKINSGDPIAIAEVVRDLHRNAGQPDQSFSERQIYESALDRLAAELAALDATDKVTAAAKLAQFLKAA